MQIAGEQCKICEAKILMASDGTWCAQCKTPVHSECLSKRQGMCPVCAKLLDTPEAHFYYSKFCSACSARNTPPRSHCPNCNNETQWDSEEQYRAFRKQVLAAARTRIAIGLVQIGFGLLIAVGYLILLGLLLQSGRWLVSGAVIFAVIYLLWSGGRKFSEGWALKRFE